jgi:hypothetical protein
MGETVLVDALLRDASDHEVTEGLERNPGSARLRERGWQPLWFEVRIEVDGNDERFHSLVWREAGRDAAEVAREELEHTLDEALRNLRDMEGYDVWPEDVENPSVRVEVT